MGGASSNVSGLGRERLLSCSRSLRRPDDARRRGSAGMHDCRHWKSAPSPPISPRSLMFHAVIKIKLEFCGINVFRSTAGPWSHNTAGSKLPSQVKESPTICPASLIASAVLAQRPFAVPASPARRAEPTAPAQQVLQARRKSRMLVSCYISFSGFLALCLPIFRTGRETAESTNTSSRREIRQHLLG